jgi:hypothetical protein
MGGTYGIRTGEGPSLGEVPAHTVTIYNHHVDQVITVEVPEDRWEGEQAQLRGCLAAVCYSRHVCSLWSTAVCTPARTQLLTPAQASTHAP